MSSYRTLQPGEPIPEGKPLRYINGGYVVLRWKVGPSRYLEAREHRLRVGGQDGEHVHHLNGDPRDNRPENLVRLTAAEHNMLHADKRRKLDIALATELYEAGYSTVAIGALLGVHHSNVYRRLASRGVRLRKRGTEAMAMPDARRRQSAGMRRFWKGNTEYRERFSAAGHSWWEGLTPEERLEHGRRISEGKRRGKRAYIKAANERIAA